MVKKVFRGCLALVVLIFVGLGAVMGVAVFGAAQDWDWTWTDPVADVVWEGEYDGSYEISAEPQTALATEALVIRASGFNANQQVALQASATDASGIKWQSAALFRADASGTVDASTQAPISGSYSGIAPMGLFWSMRPTIGKEVNFFYRGSDEYSVTISAEADGTQLVKTTVKRLNYSPDIIEEAVRTDTVVGTFVRPDGDGPHPAILIMGGSEGGIPSSAARLWASEGYAALAVGYFDVGTLPKVLSKIPLETFDNALAWLRDQPSVDAERIAIHGTSRGSEPAMLTAINNPDVAAIIAVVPSSVVWSGLDFDARAENQGQIPSAWTRNGVQLPANGNSFSMETLRSMIGRPAKLVGTFAGGLDNPAPESIMQVERINAPILLVSGTGDELWPSAEFADQIVQRLEDNQYAFPVEHLKLDGAGHYVSPTWQPPSYMFTTGVGGLVFGGSREANGQATGPFWQTQTDFLATHMAP